MKDAHLHVSRDCKMVSAILQRVGDKWTVLVVGALGDGPRRFTEIWSAVGGISQKMLTSTLRGLERDGLVTRTVYPTAPPRVDYELTDLGRDLLVPVSALGEWAFRNVMEIQTAQVRFDKDRADADPLRGIPPSRRVRA